MDKKRIARLSLLVAAVALGLAACEKAAEPSPTPPPSETPLTVIPVIPTIDLTQPPGVSDAVAAAAPNEAAVPFEVEVAAGDGLALTGLFYPASAEAPGVLLLHMLGRDKEDWNLVAAALQSAGFAVLSVDMRGHGDTGGERDWGAAQDDVRVLLEWLRAQPNVDPERLATVGGSIGANLSLIGCAAHEACRTTVLLSPGLDYHGVKTEPAMAGLSARPVLLVASEDDDYSAKTVRTLDGLAQGEHQLQVYRDAGHGTDMLAAEPGLQDLIVNWLLERLV